LTGILPIVSIHATYVIAAAEGYVPWCNPYVDSCTSISATGRYGTAFFLFKATMIPYALLLYLFWRQAGDLLERAGERTGPVRVIRRMGIIAAVFLLLYIIALGATGQYFQLVRRIGIILYFGLTALNQLLLTWRLGRIPGRDATRPIHVTLCGLLFGIGMLTVILQGFMADYTAVEDAFEWVMALIMHCYFVVMFWTWKQVPLREPAKDGR